jgi:hypothetical protein
MGRWSKYDGGHGMNKEVRRREDLSVFWGPRGIVPLRVVKDEVDRGFEAHLRKQALREEGRRKGRAKK